jgi:transcriptional regulator with XRE-family HTH domain
MNNFSERLKSARIMKGYSLQDLEDALGKRVTKQALSKYEQGLMKPDAEVLISICNALNVRPDYFHRETLLKLESVEFRKLQKLAAKEAESVKQRTIDFLERYYELENLIGIENEFINPIKHIEINSSQDVENAAKELRKLWNLGEDPIKNVVELLEDHKIKVIELTSDLAFNGLSTFVNSKHPVIVLNSNLEAHLDRKRFGFKT